MSGFSVEITVNNADKVLDEMQSAIDRALEAIGIQAENNVKMELEKPKPHANGETRPNVDTGRLVNSISHRVSPGEKAVYVGTNVEYAAYVELGTSRMKAYPYIKPGVMDHVDEYKKIAEDALKGF